MNLILKTLHLNIFGYDATFTLGPWPSLRFDFFVLHSEKFGVPFERILRVCDSFILPSQEKSI